MVASKTATPITVAIQNIGEKDSLSFWQHLLQVAMNSVYYQTRCTCSKNYCKNNKYEKQLNAFKYSHVFIFSKTIIKIPKIL